MKNKIKTILLSLCVVCTVVGMMKEIITFTTEAHAKETAEPCYIICDVTETDIETGELTVLMQDGGLQVYLADDIPESCELVCFKTNNIDNFESYEIVALR